jgi:O-acetyl-ADP-ribose deacetylase (regulator of RNase III)
MYRTIALDILKSPAQVIVHQTNCLTVRAQGLADSIFKKYPWANIYKARTPIGHKNLATPDTRGEPGSLVIVSEQETNQFKYIVNLMGQWGPGKPGSVHNYDEYPQDYADNAIQRLEWFDQGLQTLSEWSQENKIKSVSFPYHIGCGLAGGSWDQYNQLIDKFATNNPTINVTICRLN